MQSANKLFCLKGLKNNSKTDIIRLLLQNGAKIDIADSRGRTPLSMAQSSGNKEILDLFLIRKNLHKGTKINTPDE